MWLRKALIGRAFRAGIAALHQDHLGVSLAQVLQETISSHRQANGAGRLQLIQGPGS
jgi:hypothetical protein